MKTIQVFLLLCIVQAASAAQQAIDNAEIVPAQFDVAVENRAPVYPDESRKAKEEGQAILKVSIDTAGQPKSVEIYESSGYPRLDQAAIETVNDWHFIPATRAGKPVEDWMQVPIAFRLAAAVRPKILNRKDFLYAGNPVPRYPFISRRRGEEGKVILKVLLGNTPGLPKQVDLFKTSGYEALDQSALRTIQIWQFKPVKKAGMEAEKWVLLQIIFKLEK